MAPTTTQPTRTAALPPGAHLAWLAFGLGLLHAAFSVYWALGGTWLLDTVGGEIETRARAGDTTIRIIVWVTAGLKLIAALAGPLAVRPALTGTRRRLVRFTGWAAAVVLILYSGVQTLTGVLVTLGVIAASPTANMRAIAWHAFFWQPWFLLWGLSLAGALWRSRSITDANADANTGITGDVAGDAVSRITGQDRPSASRQARGGK